MLVPSYVCADVFLSYAVYYAYSMLYITYYAEYTFSRFRLANVP